jgi:hypothetical protein
MTPVTVFEISSFLAHTQRFETYLISEGENDILCEHKVKRKLYSKRFKKSDCIILAGHNLPVKADSDGNSWSGNACFNLIGDAETVKKLIEEKAVYSVSNKLKEKITIGDGSKQWNEDLLYPDLAKLSNHAVVRRMVEKIG